MGLTRRDARPRAYHVVHSAAPGTAYAVKPVVRLPFLLLGDVESEFSKHSGR